MIKIYDTVVVGSGPGGFYFSPHTCKGWTKGSPFGG